MLRLLHDIPCPGPRQKPATGWLARRLIFWVCAVVILSVNFTARADDAEFDQYKVKAAFIYNFAKYVQWPAVKLAADAPIVIGLSSGSPLFAQLQELLRNRKANGHPLVVTNCATLEQARNVHIFFAGVIEEKWSLPELRALELAQVLTIGESDRFARYGGLITFVAEKAKLRFKVNLPTGEEPSLQLSSQLLKLAVSVDRHGESL